MNVVDILIIIFAISSVVRGYSIGLIRQIGSTVGFVIGLFVGSYISTPIISHIHGSLNKSLTSLLVVLTACFIFTTLGEYLGLRMKSHVTNKSLNKIDGEFGSVISVVTTLFAAWLVAAILILTPPNAIQQLVKGSRIVAELNRELPPATKLLSSLNKLIDPNGFPQVFTGREPGPKTTAKLPSLGSFDSVVAATRGSVVKIEGAGCGGIVEGSGFVVTPDEIATNAHVVAGVGSPKVLDANGTHNARVVWFDTDLDLAVLRVSNLAGKPLTLNTAIQAAGTPGVVLGYPGGGDFDAQAASVIDQFTALGRNIYGEGATQREVYSLQAKVIPGNSGGPVIGADGRVLGIVFATSTQYNNVGYAFTAQQASSELAEAKTSNTTYSTGACSE